MYKGRSYHTLHLQEHILKRRLLLPGEKGSHKKKKERGASVEWQSPLHPILQCRVVFTHIFRHNSIKDCARWCLNCKVIICNDPPDKVQGPGHCGEVAQVLTRASTVQPLVMKGDKDSKVAIDGQGQENKGDDQEDRSQSRAGYVDKDLDPIVEGAGAGAAGRSPVCRGFFGGCGDGQIIFGGGVMSGKRGKGDRGGRRGKHDYAGEAMRWECTKRRKEKEGRNDGAKERGKEKGNEEKRGWTRTKQKENRDETRTK